MGAVRSPQHSGSRSVCFQSAGALWCPSGSYHCRELQALDFPTDRWAQGSWAVTAAGPLASVPTDCHRRGWVCHQSLCVWIWSERPRSELLWTACALLSGGKDQASTSGLSFWVYSQRSKIGALSKGEGKPVVQDPEPLWGSTGTPEASKDHCLQAYGSLASQVLLGSACIPELVAPGPAHTSCPRGHSTSYLHISSLSCLLTLPESPLHTNVLYFFDHQLHIHLFPIFYTHSYSPTFMLKSSKHAENWKDC